MAIAALRTNRELETLRIERPQEQPRRKRSRLVSIAILMLLTTVLGAASYVIYGRTIGRSPTVQTMMVVARTNRQPSVLLTGSGYVVTRHKYITIGTKILGQIVEEPIEEGQHIKAGDILARIDDRDYQAQLRQAIAMRDVAKANLHLLQDKANRARHLMTGAISTDDFETAITAAEVAQAQLKREEAAVDYAKFNVQIARPDLQIIKPEMSAKVSFLENQPAATQQPRITVPKGAVRIAEGATSVWTVREGIVHRVGIVRGQETETGIEIKQGLHDGDVVVVSPPANLANGRKVSVGTE